MKYFRKFAIMLLFAGLCVSSQVWAQPSQPYMPEIERALNYLVSHFNPKVGLIYESEDAGKTHWLARTEYPNFTWNYSQVFWLYSDNLFAEYALFPYNPELAHKINATIHRYNPPFSNKFEAVIGSPVGPDRAARDVIVNESETFVTLYRIHDGAIGDPKIPFGDAIIYRALSEYYLGETDLAVRDVNWTASLWNGTCLVDHAVTQRNLTATNAPSDIQWCTNMKVALLLYGAQVIGVNLPNFKQLEAHLWSMQTKNGGITTLATGQGQPSGSTNCETTALTLLVYNQALISRLHEQPISKLTEAEGPTTLLVFALFALMAVVQSMRKNKTCQRHRCIYEEICLHGIMHLHITRKHCGFIQWHKPCSTLDSSLGAKSVNP